MPVESDLEAMSANMRTIIEPMVAGLQALRLVVLEFDYVNNW